MRDGKYAEPVPDYSEWARRLKQPRPGTSLIGLINRLLLPIGGLMDRCTEFVLQGARHLEKSRRFCEGRDAKPGEIAMVRYYPDEDKK